MKKIVWFYLLIGLLCAGCGAAADPQDELAFVEDVMRSYKGWEKANEEPLQTAFQILLMCTLPPPHLTEFTDSEHGFVLTDVYGNEAAMTVLQTAGAREFPIGSVIVKQKLNFSESSNLVDAGSGIMSKEAEGWVYYYRTVEGEVGSGSAVAHCAGCHEDAAEHDYVFYPQTALESLDSAESNN